MMQLRYAMKFSFDHALTMRALTCLMLCGAALLLGGKLAAQVDQEWCGTRNVLDFQLKRQPDLIERALKRREARAAGMAKTAEDRIYRFPVVVHIIHDNGIENISKAQIESMITVLNNAFRHVSLNPDYTPTADFGNGADIGFEFFLAKRDPEGNCTDGIVRVQSPMTVHKPFNDEGEFDYPLDSALKNLSRWDTRKYVNIWVIRSMGRTGGYAYLPWESTITDFLDGIVVRHDASGNINSSMFHKTLAHEMGHYFGLMHPFDNGHPRMRPEVDSCGGKTPETCRDSGDYVCDTPPSTRDFQDCEDRNTCSELPIDRNDNKENYMAYNEDRCRNMFTVEQRELMYSYLEEYRLAMAAEENLQATGFYDSLTVEPIGVVAICADLEARRLPVRLKASGADSYTWAPATGLNRTDGPEVELLLDQVGFFDYTVTGTGVGCGSETQQVRIKVVSPRPLSFSANYQEEQNGLASVQVDAGGGVPPYKYVIEPRKTFQPNFWQDLSRFEDIPTGNYTVSVMDAAGCVQTRPLNVTVSRDKAAEAWAGLRLYPNPNSDSRLHLEFPANHNGEMSWRMVGVDGREVASGAENVTQGWNRLTLPVEKLPAGVWFLHLRDGAGQVRVLPWVRL